MSSRAISNMDVNQDIKLYFHYYLNLPVAPNFAVEINGKWGIGKTFLVKSYIDEYFLGAKNRCAYVSLYGLASREEIDKNIMFGLHPSLRTKAAQYSGFIAKLIVSLKRIKAKIDYKFLRGSDKNKVFIFDDLERCPMSKTAVLGYINEFVEHSGCKVIIITNDEKIEKDSNYDELKEKIIGQTLIVQPSFHDAFNSFIFELKDEDLISKLIENKSLICDLFFQSDIHNFRSLRMAILTLERLYQAIPAKYKNDSEATTAIICISIIIALEVRAGGLTLGEIKSRGEYLLKSSNNTSFEMNKKYTSFDISNSILNGNVLADVFISGIIDVEKIIKSLDQSQYFFIKNKEPSWVTVWNGYERSGDDFNNALIDMENKFSNREYNDIGEYLHVFSLKFWLSNNGIYKKSHSDVINECKRCIDDLCKEKHICTGEKINYNIENIVGLYGYGFREPISIEFRTVFDYLKKSINKVFKENHSSFAYSIINKLPNDIAGFQRALVNSDIKNGDYGSEDILISIPCELILSKMLECAPEKWFQVFSVFQRRYDANSFIREKEKDWLKNMVVELNVRMEHMSDVDKARLNNVIKWCIEPYIE
ncbi:P-loop NTPase fold protein [Yersinia enterocolitica]|nr:hypothetical protein [Yersinia enterocolitica]EKN4086881.1 hypothetical protein [Yersinia enterocolitica]EKN4157218.1 hypothetical protein [Yersinia enterocolitica]EKN4707859.1 hypothetical protein [Yersinia enterocolitica]EKN6148189.1 hypothetical protein [Yersinia enterocolitica]